MQVKVSRNYTVEFTNEEIVDGLCYMLSHLRSSTESVQVASLIRNADGGVELEYTDSGLIMSFVYEDEVVNES